MGRHGRDRMVVGFTTCAISAYCHYSCKFVPRPWRDILDTTLCDKACQWLATGRWFSPVSSTNKTDRHDITEILLKVALNTINHQILECFHVVFPSGYAIFTFHIRKVSQRGEKIQWQNKDKRQSLLQPPKLYVHNGNESFHLLLRFFLFPLLPIRA